jgi:hypothetical protein
MTMQAHLNAVEAALPELLADAAGWKSLNIDYHPPRVQRLYRDWNGVRVSLHRVWPCAPEDALIHPHPWPSAMRLIAGRYRMWIGYGAGQQTPPLAALVELAAGSSYIMEDPHQWHAVMPIGEPTLSLMVTGQPWDRAMPLTPDKTLQPLSAGVAGELLDQFAAAWAAR